MKFTTKCSADEILQLGQHIVSTKCTIRKCAKDFGLSKSTVFNYMRIRLPKIDSNVSVAVFEILRYNKSQRHIRGGAATKARWEAINRSRNP